MAKTSIAAQGQIWYVQPETDNEIKTNKMKKIRPWLIISPDDANFTSSGYIGVPITHNASFNNGYKIEIECPTKPGKAFDKSWVISYKPRTIDENELLSYIGSANKELVDQCVDYLYAYLKQGNNSIEFTEYTKPIEIECMDVVLPINNSEEYKDFIKAEIEMDTASINMPEHEDKDEDDEIIRKYKMKYPNSKNIDKYKDIKDSYKILEYMNMYSNNKKAFIRKFNISNKTAFKFKKELERYYNFLLDSLLEKCTND